MHLVFEIPLMFHQFFYESVHVEDAKNRKEIADERAIRFNYILRSSLLPSYPETRKHMPKQT